MSKHPISLFTSEALYCCSAIFVWHTTTDHIIGVFSKFSLLWNFLFLNDFACIYWEHWELLKYQIFFCRGSFLHFSKTAWNCPDHWEMLKSHNFSWQLFNFLKKKLNLSPTLKNTEILNFLPMGGRGRVVLRSGIALEISFLKNTGNCLKNTKKYWSLKFYFKGGRACTVKCYLLGQGSLTPFTIFILVSYFIVDLSR